MFHCNNICRRKEHCEDWQQTMPVNVFPASWSCPPKQSAMILSLFAHDFASAACFLKGTCIRPQWNQGKTKALFNLIMTYFSWFYHLNVGHALEYLWGKGRKCIKTYLVLNLALWLFFFIVNCIFIWVYVCVCVSMLMHVCAQNCWVCRRIPNCSVSEQLHLTT